MDISIICYTKENAKKVLKIAKDLGYVWCSGTDLEEVDYFVPEGIVYDLDEARKTVTYDRIYKDYNITDEEFISKYSNGKFNPKNETIGKLKNGMDLNN